MKGECSFPHTPFEVDYADSLSHLKTPGTFEWGKPIVPLCPATGQYPGNRIMTETRLSSNPDVANPKALMKGTLPVFGHLVNLIAQVGPS